MRTNALVTSFAFTVAGLGLCFHNFARAEQPALQAKPSPPDVTKAHPHPGVAKARFQQILAKQRKLIKSQEEARQSIVRALGFGSGDFPGLCRVPPAVGDGDVDVNRSLFVHDRATLDAGDFSLKRTLAQMAAQANSGGAVGVNERDLFRQLWDTQNPEPGLGLGPNCNSITSVINGATVASLNEFPNDCRPNEGQEATATSEAADANIASYKPIALVNRLDLAGEKWRNCGEHRIVYGKQPGGASRNLIILEAVLPNPRPGCREACMPVARFWKSLSDPAFADPVARGQALEQFFYNGLPGFRPVVHIDHYSSANSHSKYSGGTGQIRTDQFMSGTVPQRWQLREFKTVLDCGSRPCAFRVVPTMVKINPFGPLWNEDVANDPANTFSARASAFQAELLTQVPNLANSDINVMGYSVTPEFDAAQSNSHPGAPSTIDNYRVQMSLAAGPADTFRTTLDASAAAAVPALNKVQVANRALAVSCAGCHQPRTFQLNAPTGDLGPLTMPDGSTTTSWPDSLGFVHVSEATTEALPRTGAFGAEGLGHEISPALKTAFLPGRKKFLIEQLNKQACLCLRRFPKLHPRRAARLLELERGAAEATLKEGTDDGRFIEKLPKGMGVKQLIERLRRNAELDSARDNEVASKLKGAGVAPSDATLDVSAHAEMFDAKKRSHGNKKREEQLRQQQVLRQLAEEPPRLTVTNSFRVH